MKVIWFGWVLVLPWKTMGIRVTPPSHIFFFSLPAQRVGGRPSHNAGELRRSLWSTGTIELLHPPGLWFCLLSVFCCACS
ncbi:hypothetical protein HOY80DRAFT_971657 [Tuber brumale]|nr:hypothetical protein HOY80DRAFT_971657 [Tuber brumale]